MANTPKEKKRFSLSVQSLNVMLVRRRRSCRKRILGRVSKLSCVAANSSKPSIFRYGGTTTIPGGLSIESGRDRVLCRDISGVKVAGSLVSLRLVVRRFVGLLHCLFVLEEFTGMSGIIGRDASFRTKVISGLWMVVHIEKRGVRGRECLLPMARVSTSR